MESNLAQVERTREDGFSLTITAFSMATTLLLCLIYLAELEDPCSQMRIENGDSGLQDGYCEHGSTKNRNGNQLAVEQYPEVRDLPSN